MEIKVASTFVLTNHNMTTTIPTTCSMKACNYAHRNETPNLVPKNDVVRFHWFRSLTVLRLSDQHWLLFIIRLRTCSYTCTKLVIKNSLKPSAPFELLRLFLLVPPLPPGPSTYTVFCMKKYLSTVNVKL